MNGIVAEVKRFAVHDGPGIRTTLFLKGCPLRCRWCHNPEMERMERELAFFAHKCIGCGACVGACPEKVHTLRDGKRGIDRKKCVFSGKCVEACPADALRIYGRSVSADEAEKILLEDAEFYGGDGGITLSGGEPLLQAEFCEEVLRAVRKAGIGTAVDTCAEVPWEAFERTIPYTSLYLLDFKHADSEEHKRLTGRGNERIRENFLRLASLNIPAEVRIPLIPGSNDSEENLRKSAEFLAPMRNITRVRILPYHSLARSKYAALGIPDTMPDVEPPSPAALERAADFFRRTHDV